MPAAIPIIAAVAAAAVSSALAPKPPKPPDPIAPPTPLATPTVMPVADGDAANQARRRSLAEQSARRGRASTILTDQSDKLGVAP